MWYAWGIVPYQVHKLLSLIYKKQQPPFPLYIPFVRPQSLYTWKFQIPLFFPNINVYFGRKIQVLVYILYEWTKHLYYPFTLYNVTTFTFGRNVYITPEREAAGTPNINLCLILKKVHPPQYLYTPIARPFLKPKKFPENACRLW